MSKKLVALVLSLFMMLAIPFGGFAEGATSEPLIELHLRCDWNTDGLIEPLGDVVSPYIQDRFGIRVASITNDPPDSSLAQNLTMWMAAGNMPSVLPIYIQQVPLVLSTEYFYPLTDWIKEYMPNYMKAFPEELWKYSDIDGQQWGIKDLARPANPPIPADEDPYDVGDFGHGVWVREDILTMLGYEFTPMAELQKITTDVGIKPTEEQLLINPPIDSDPYVFADFLRKVKELDLKATDGQDLIPFSFMYWKVHHFASLFDSGYWGISDEGVVGGYLGSPEAKEYMQWFNTIYQEGLLDADFMVQTHNQYAEKIGTGGLAVGFYGDVDMIAAREALKSSTGTDIRFIHWPKKYDDRGWYDVNVPGGMVNWMISKSLSEEEAIRLLKFWDWLYTDEGQDIVSWGPESAGLWTMVDGVKKFADPQVENDCLNYVRNGKGADFYGLYDKTGTSGKSFSPIVANSPMGKNFHDFERSYPAAIDLYIVSRNIMGRNGLDYEGRGALSDGSELIANVSTWWWNEFIERDVAKLFQAKDQAAFDQAWDEVYKSFDETVNYEACKEAMTKYFKEVMGK